jgi:speckle-type POZ protein
MLAVVAVALAPLALVVVAGILDSAAFSDVTVCVDGKSIPAHRTILAARSDVFKAMLEMECRESVSRKVDIQDITYPVVMMMLR